MAVKVEGAAYTIEIVVSDSRHAVKHAKIRKTMRWDDEPRDVKERAEAAADRFISEYPDHVLDVREWPDDWSQVWYLDPA